MSAAADELVRLPSCLRGVLYAQVVSLAQRTACRRFGTLAMICAVLASCGSTSAPAAEPEAAAAVEQIASLSPLEGELGFASEPGRRQFQLINQQRAADLAMVQCMESAGFFYATLPAEAALRSGPFVGDGTRDWTAQNGLGVTSSLVNALAADASGPSEYAATANFNYVASLSDPEAAAYDQALVGDLSAPSTAEGYRPAGCWGSSFSGIVDVLALIDAFAPELDSLNTRLNADPRMLEFQRTWSTCMDAQGYNYENEQALADDVYARLLEIEVVEVAGANQVASPESLDELAAFERKVALAGFDCRQSFASALDQLRFDYEQEFLDDNRFRIADFRSGAGE